jgi:acyl-CoA reductase-like NAD-dependent aldehyde dehydrogenase
LEAVSNFPPPFLFSSFLQVKSDAEALSLINDSPYGLTASIWTKDEAAYWSLVDDIDAGTVFLNRFVLVSLFPPSSLLFPLSSSCHLHHSAVSLTLLLTHSCDYLDPALPWTGFKDSGRGISLSRYGFDAVTKAKSLHLRQ